MDRRTLIVGAAASVASVPARAEDDETARLRDALERIALLDEADGHFLTVRHAHRAVGIACAALGNRHPSEILVEREARIRRRDGPLPPLGRP